MLTSLPVFIALGSNLGDSAQRIHAAMLRLEPLSTLPLRRSSLWQTEPIDCPPGSARFVNAAVALAPRPGETPSSLLQKLLALESDFGRVRTATRNAPRPLDLDIIAWGNLILNTPNLVLPHPRAFQRRFVLAPLAELAPDWIPPGHAESIAELLAKIGGEEEICRLAGGVS